MGAPDQRSVERELMLKVEEKPLLILIEDDLETLMHEHWREAGSDHEDVPFDPDWGSALHLERDGVLRTFGLFRDGELIGYAGFEVCPHLHFKTTRHAFNSGIYVKPEHRGLAGGKLFAGSEALLKAMGVKKITYSAPFASNLNKVLEKGGYRASETYFTKIVS